MGAGSVLTHLGVDALGANTAFGSAAEAFPQGVAAGDPLPDRGTIWTRVAPPTGDADVFWEISANVDFVGDGVQSGTVTAGTADDHTVKVELDGLESDCWYFYRFTTPTATSEIGRLRTAPAPGAPADRVRFAFASCQQRNDSHYVALRAIANEDVDFLVHLGDYIYVNDDHTRSIDDYRNVYATFKSEPLLRECHAAVPIVAMWDDGEFYNGIDRTGDPHQPDRLTNAVDAWFDYFPLLRRPDDPGRAYRALGWGDLFDLFMIDVRSYRDPAVEEVNSLSAAGREMFAAGRTTLGADQISWLESGLGNSVATWKLIGNPYNMMPFRLVDLDFPQLRKLARALNRRWQRNAGIYAPNEAWDDYQAERGRLLEFIRDQGVTNVSVVSGHTHLYFAGDLIPDFDDPASNSVATEFVAGSLTADPDPRTLFGSLPRSWAEAIIHLGEDIVKAVNPYYEYVNFLDQGYAIVEVTPEELSVEFRLVDTFDPNAEAFTGARFRVLADDPHVRRIGP